VKRRNITAIIIFIIFYVSFGAYLTLNQEKIIYQPFAQDFDSCQAFSGAQKVDEAGTRMYVSGTSKPVVVLYHGNAGSACDRWFYANLFQQAGYDFVIVEYAGYSNDDREPSHTLIRQDVKNVITWLERSSITDVTIVGESIGTGVASYHTYLKPPRQLLLITPFTDLATIARQRFWFYPTSLLVENAYDNVTALATYQGKTHIIHGENDTLIPYALGRELYETLPGEKTFVTIPDAGHNNLFASPDTIPAIQTFLKPEVISLNED